MSEDEKIPFTAHLEELRSRLIAGFIAVGTSSSSPDFPKPFLPT